ncbi:class I adenylate-forming enzyme family protein [Cupriavidus taiwanensis]|uniref:class I adenylate-forming enzyme family protein n=1 Tax=Cupriavidus taiwanensis TaxID=164546 RepID=UPI002540752D|nr:class I adenylate-forming enzyme family protein [Cupriavidus taiwanensis]MDK3025424.1 class I adenylate-forming enzyme family protein [Cupriavidus taiwanensis]
MQLSAAELQAKLAALPDRMSHVVRPWAQRSPDAIALSEGARVMTYRELAQAIQTAGQWLIQRGVRPGDRVMVLGENSIALAILVLAIGDIDAWPLVVNARISEREVSAIRTHSGARLVIATSSVSPDAARHAQQMSAALHEIPGVGEVAVTDVDPAATAEPVSADGARQVGALIYTSGTTGTPKGVMLSHRSVMFTALIGGVMRGFGPDDFVYGVLPMSHIVGFSSVLIGTLMFGARLELVPRFDARAALRALSNDGITRFQGVPTMFQRLLEASNGAISCPALRGIGVAGAPLDLTLKRAVETAFRLPLQNGYGITECAPTIAFTRVDDPRDDTTVGPPIPEIEVRLKGTTGEWMPSGEVGELHVRGPNVMLGYYKAPEMTAQVVDPEGWFNTGDLARMDGPYLHIVGRTKELIIRSGFNVYPPEVEAVLAAHPAVASCAVVGRRVPGNEEVVAFVQLKPGTEATPDEIGQFAAQHLAPYKRPAEVFIRTSLPATSAGKILKHELAKEASRDAS